MTFDSVYINAAGTFLPGAPVTNDQLDDFIQPLDHTSSRIKKRILRENGILTRHYALDPSGKTVHSVSQMGAEAVRHCLSTAGLPVDKVSLLCTGTSGSDTALPGLANMLQGELGAPPMETSSHHGVCAAGISALKYAALSLSQNLHERALVVASEFPSRLFKKSRFATRDYHTDFDSHFLRWMLSDGAGALLLSRKPNTSGLTLKLRRVHLKSFSGDYPVCMQTGYPEKNKPTSYLDYPSFADAEREGAFSLRQDLRLLPHLFDLGVHEYARLVQQGWLDPAKISHFLCHYSSEKFAPVVKDLLEKAQLDIPKDRWFSNLKTRGNTGAASIFIMLEEFLRTRPLKAGDQVFCFIPESGRFTVGYVLMEVVDAAAESVARSATTVAGVTLPEPPQPSEVLEHPELTQTLRALCDVWHDFRSRFFRTPFVQRIVRGEVTREDYVRWMANWIPQVREGSLWMREAAANVSRTYPNLRAMIDHHASEEQFDFRVLFDDYKAAGGTAESIDALRRNVGGEALNAFMHFRASQVDAVDLMGAIYVIEGTGSRIIPTLLPLLRRQLPFSDGVFRFLRYHGENDENHLAEWRQALQVVLKHAPDASVQEAIVRTARITAELYLMQMENV